MSDKPFAVSQVEAAGLIDVPHRHARLYIGRTDYDERVYLAIELRRIDNPSVPVGLTMSGEAFDGDYYDQGHCSAGGQCDEMVRDVLGRGRLAKGRTADQVAMLLHIWARWHMNQHGHGGSYGRGDPEPLPDEVLAWLRPLMDKHEQAFEEGCISCLYVEQRASDRRALALNAVCRS